MCINSLGGTYLKLYIMCIAKVLSLISANSGLLYQHFGGITLFLASAIATVEPVRS